MLKRIKDYIFNNSLFIASIFLLVLIPLYPKLPIIGIAHTWVYIRAEDFFIALTLILWIILLIKKKITFKTPLTIPILIFWLVGLIATLNAIFFIFPTLPGMFPKIAILHWLRRVEYLSLFFVGYFAINDKKKIPVIVTTLAVVVVAAFIYGIGQRYLGFPAFLTMNEEFAKGIPLRLSPLARIPSTFGGHYDLAAYLVMVIPILGSMIFGFKKYYVKILLLLASGAGLILLLMTSSRISFLVYLLTVTFLLVIQKKKIWILPVLVLSVLIMNSFNGISQRFASTITEVDLVVDARTGKPVGIAKSTDQAKDKPIVIEENQSTGESLPQGTGFINLPSEVSEKTVTKVVYKKLKVGGEATDITTIEGDFVIKKALAYDVSFTTRFQGEWPRALEAFSRNKFIGSGYSSISLATDSDYLRMLGETGVLGVFSFIFIFLILAIFIRQVLAEVESRTVRSLTLGVIAGIFGICLNAVLIDVFEASKVALSFWLIVGLTLGSLKLYKTKKINYLKELKELAISPVALVIYISALTIAVYSIMLNNFFVGNDFVWLRWAADCKKVLLQSGMQQCESTGSALRNYFSSADNFFYRPGAKSYFYFMYGFFWLNPIAYHISSLFIHIANIILVFIISLKLFKSKYFALISGLFFSVLSVQSESVFWISSTGYIVSVMFLLLGVTLYAYRTNDRLKYLYLILSFVSLCISTLFHEIAMVGPLIVIAYGLFENKEKIKNVFRWEHILYAVIIPVYLYIRYLTKSNWLDGEYKWPDFPPNLVSSIVNYFGISAVGSKASFFIQDNFALMLIIFLFLIAVVFSIYKFVINKVDKNKRKVLLFGVSVFVLGLMPFSITDSISFRYAYLASFGFIIFLVLVLQLIFNDIKNKKIAFAIISLFTLIFAVYHISELIRINKDWQRAGMISNQLLVGFNENFAKTKAATNNPVFYFVNVPSEVGNAKLFPTGISDALWFTFQREYLTVLTGNDLDKALDYAEASASARIFTFDKDGNVSEVVRTKENIVVPNKK